jgi:hypothetical protein
MAAERRQKKTVASAMATSMAARRRWSSVSGAELGCLECGGDEWKGQQVAGVSRW